MGFQVRKRTRGKKGWWNGSYSRKGVGVSGSIKYGKNVTLNTGDLSSNRKTPSRITFNLGNGIRYVIYGSRKKAKSKETTPTPTRSSSRRSTRSYHPSSYIIHSGTYTPTKYQGDGWTTENTIILLIVLGLIGLVWWLIANGYGVAVLVFIAFWLVFVIG